MKQDLYQFKKIICPNASHHQNTNLEEVTAYRASKPLWTAKRNLIFAALDQIKKNMLKRIRS